MNPNTVVVAFDQLCAGFTIGVTVYFFFIQSPKLVLILGKEKFVPLMMALTRLWVKVMFASSSALLLSSVWLSNKGLAVNLYLVGIGWVAMAINYFVVVPAALKAGASSARQRKGDNSKNLKEFVIKGGDSGCATKNLHQTVVVFVLIMVGAFIAHLVDFAGNAT